MTERTRRSWLALAAGEHVGYDSERKETFLQGARQYLQDLARELGLPKGSYDLRVNRGGIAVSGEVTLHTDHVYVQVAQSVMGGEYALLYRTCRGRKDYTGGGNCWLTWRDLASLDEAAGRIRQLVPEYREPLARAA